MQKIAHPIRVTLVTPYREMTTLALEMVEEWKQRGVTLEVKEAIGTEAAMRLKIDADVAIARGITGGALRRVLPESTPFVEINTTGYDIISAIYECLKKPEAPRPYTIIGDARMIHGAQSIIKLLDVPLEVVPVGTEEEGREFLQTRCMNGERTIISGSTLQGVAERRGIPAVLIKSGKEALETAIEEAVTIARTALKERAAAEQIRLGLNALGEGVIMIDEAGMISDCNTRAARLLLGAQASAASMVGSQAARFLSSAGGEPYFGGVLPSKEKFSILHLKNGSTLLLSYYPVLVDSVAHGGVITLQDAGRIQAMEGSIRASLHAQKPEAKYTFSDCAGSSSSFSQCLEKALRYSKTESAILLYGETGTGKEIIAQSIHKAGPRASGPFVAVNCASFPESLLESTLFGYVGGAFTGAAKEGRQGLFELAHGGTLFLDEVSEIPLALQGRLLRVLQEQEVMRLGHDKVTPVNVRVIAASNRNLGKLVEADEFRGDLLYRLNVLSLTLPPLRERKGDVAVLASRFMDKRQTLGEDALQLMNTHAWPGNIRELRNFCERLSVLCSGEVITANEAREAFDMDDVARPSAQAPVAVANAASEHGTIHDAEIKAIMDALARNSWHKGRAAQELGISRSTLWRKLNSAGLAPDKN